MAVDLECHRCGHEWKLKTPFYLTKGKVQWIMSKRTVQVCPSCRHGDRIELKKEMDMLTDAIKNLQKELNLGGAKPPLVEDGIAGAKTLAELAKQTGKPSAHSATQLMGVDVSHHNGVFDWAKCKAQGNVFAFVKASEGASFVDSQFAHNWDAAKRAGLIVGAYHFFRSNQDAMAQATHFVKTVGSLDGRLPAVLDWETADGMTVQQQYTKALLWLNVVEENTGKRPFIYSGSSFIADHKLPYEFTKYPLWLAHYGVSKPRIPAPWTDYAFWQYTDAGGLDKNFFNGSLEDLQKMVG